MTQVQVTGPYGVRIWDARDIRPEVIALLGDVQPVARQVTLVDYFGTWTYELVPCTHVVSHGVVDGDWACEDCGAPVTHNELY